MPTTDDLPRMTVDELLIINMVNERKNQLAHVQAFYGEKPDAIDVAMALFEVGDTDLLIAMKKARKKRQRFKG